MKKAIFIDILFNIYTVCNLLAFYHTSRISKFTDLYNYVTVISTKGGVLIFLILPIIWILGVYIRSYSLTRYSILFQGITWILMGFNFLNLDALTGFIAYCFIGILFLIRWYNLYLLKELEERYGHSRSF